VQEDGAMLVHLDMDAADFARLDREHRIGDDIVLDGEALAASVQG